MATPSEFTYPIDATYKPPNSDKTVLITGVNGYIASHIAFLLLKKGYKVRGTSRRTSTLDDLHRQPALAPFKGSDQLQHVVVRDITKPGAFDEAVRGVYAIIHAASPVDFTLKSVDEFFGPAIGGVNSIIVSANAEAHRKQSSIHLIQLSSIAAVVDRWRFPPISAGGSENHAYSETDWNISGEQVARDSERNGPFLPMVAYGASKATAERAMWDWVEAHPDSLLQCSAVCPGVVTGPCVVWPEVPEKLNETLMPVWNIWSGSAKRENQIPPLIGGNSYIDVRDLAALHIWLVENPDQSAGQRYLATNGKAPPQAIADLLRDDNGLYPGEMGKSLRDRIIIGNPGEGYMEGFGWPEWEPTVKSTKAYHAMGVKRFRGFEESVKDTVEAFRQQWPNSKP